MNNRAKNAAKAASDEKSFNGKVFGLILLGEIVVCAAVETIKYFFSKKKEVQKQTSKKTNDQEKSELKIKEMNHKAELDEKAAQNDHYRKMEFEEKKQSNWEKRQELKASSHAKTIESETKEDEVAPTPPSTFTFNGKVEYTNRTFYKKGGVNLLAAKSSVGKSRFTMQSAFNLCGMSVVGLYGEGSPVHAYACYYYDYEMRDGFDLRYRNQVNLLNFYRRDMSKEESKTTDVHSSAYLLKLMRADLEMASNDDIVMVVDTIGNLSDVRNKSEVNKFVEGLQQLCNEYNKQPNRSLTFILLQHLDEEKAKDKNSLHKAYLRGSQQFNSLADQTVLLGITKVEQCIRVKIAKNRYGKEQSDKVLLFKEDGIFYKYLGEYLEEHVLLYNHEKKISVDQFIFQYKPVANPTYMHDKQTGRGRPTKLTQQICMAILNARSQGQSKNEASKYYGFTRQAYNEALVKYGLVDNYPDGNWKA